MRRALIPIAGLAVFLWAGEAWSQERSQTQQQTQQTTQTQQQTMNQIRLRQHALRDANGDGICDHCGNPVGSGRTDALGKSAKKGKHWGPGDGTGNQGVGPQNGTGYGAQSGQRVGPRDGTGRQTTAGPRFGGGQGRRGSKR